MILTEVVPWGRTLDEYERMFNLSSADRAKRILGIGDGPASFNAEMTVAGYMVVSIDPIYSFTATDLKQRIDETYKTIVEQLEKNQERYVWTTFPDVESVVRARMEAMDIFFRDYEPGLHQRRYLPVSLPALPFADGAFDLVVCSHLLFLYEEQLSATFHLESIREMIRVADDVRIFPIVSLSGQRSSYVDNVLTYCLAKGIQANVVDVDYHFQKGAYQMLHLTRKTV